MARPKDVAKYITPISGIDLLLIKHQIEPKHQIDTAKTCQHHPTNKNITYQQEQEPE